MDFHLQCLPEAIFSVTRWRSSAAQSQVDWSGSHRPKQLRLQRARLRSERLRLAERKLSGTIFVTSRGWPCRTGCQKVCQALWHMQGLICGAFRKRAPRRRSTHNNRLNAGWAWLSRVASNPLMAAQAKVTGLLNQCGGMTLLLHLVMLNGSETWKRRQPTYLKRVQGLAGDLGIALGFSSLGVRKPRSSNQGASLKRTWRATGSPCEWNATVLIEELTHAGLQNVKVLSRKSWGKQVEWWAEATAKDHDFFEISTGSLFVVVIATPASKLKRQTVKKLASGERGSCFQIHERQRKKSPELSKRLEGLFTLARLSNRKKCRQRWLTPLLALQKVNLCGGKLATIARKDKVRRLPKTAYKTAGGDVEVSAWTQSPRQPWCWQLRVWSFGSGIGPWSAKASKKRQGFYHQQFETACRTLSTMAGTKGAYEWGGAMWILGCLLDIYLTKLAKVGAWGGSIELGAGGVHYDRPIVSNCCFSAYWSSWDLQCSGTSWVGHPFVVLQQTLWVFGRSPAWWRCTASKCRMGVEAMMWNQLPWQPWQGPLLYRLMLVGVGHAMLQCLHSYHKADFLSQSPCPALLPQSGAAMPLSRLLLRVGVRLRAVLWRLFAGKMWRRTAGRRLQGDLGLDLPA